MKTMNLSELKTLVIRLNEVLKGAQLQTIVSNDRGLALGFQHLKYQWLVVDMNPAHPFCLIFEEHCPFIKAAKPKPLALFLNSHAKNLYFREAQLEEAYGRVLKLELSAGEKECQIEVQLIPKQANVLVESEGKKISWEKPRELQQHAESPAAAEVRSLEAIHSEWLQELKHGNRPGIDPKVQWEKKKAKDLEKKRKALDEIQKLLEENPAEKFYEIGTHLKTITPEGFHKSSVPSEMHRYLDFKQNLFTNIQTVFEKAKHASGKIAGTAERKKILEQEIQDLEKLTFEQSEKQQKRPKLDDLMAPVDAKGRKLHLESGAIVYCGKSAADNLALLRRAKAWDYWLHLKDYPGAHGIIHRTRDQEIPFEEIQKAALWVLKESLSGKKQLDRDKYVVVMVECRFVRPIKGDKLGRVTYHSEKQFTVSAKS